MKKTPEDSVIWGWGGDESEDFGDELEGLMKVRKERVGKH